MPLSFSKIMRGPFTSTAIAPPIMMAHGRLSDDIVNEIIGVPERVPPAVAHGRLSDDIVNEISGVPGRRRNVIYGVGVSENQVPDGAETVLRPRSRRR